MTCGIENCLFLVNICFVAPSQFALYMHNTKMYTQGILVSVQPNSSSNEGTLNSFYYTCIYLQFLAIINRFSYKFGL